MNNTRFATVIHILSLLAKSKEEWLTSDWIAGSININPVIVRKELSLLQSKGWVVSKKGKEGGAMLSVSPEELTVADIYRLVKNAEVLGKKHHKPNPKCPVGKNINEKLDALFMQTEELLVSFLASKKLVDFAEALKA